MPRKSYSEEFIFSVLRELKAGALPSEVSRKHGVHMNTLQAWRVKYHNMTLNDVKRLRQVEDENRKLKHMVAEQALDIRSLKELLAKNF